MSFDSIAPLYRLLETIAFANRLQSARVTFLDQIPSPQRALIAGEGNGRFLRELLQKHPATVVDCVDASARMLQLARERVHGDSRTQHLHEDLVVWSPEENAYDLIVTHFFLDCFTQGEIALWLRNLLAQLHLTPLGCLRTLRFHHAVLRRFMRNSGFAPCIDSFA